MATNNTKPVKEAKEKAGAKAVAVEKATQPTESTYAAAELAKAHKTLGTSYEIVAVALKQAGKERATITEAKEIVDRFIKREVK